MASRSLILKTSPRTLVEVGFLRGDVGKVIEGLPVRNASHLCKVRLMTAVDL